MKTLARYRWLLVVGAVDLALLGSRPAAGATSLRNAWQFLLSVIGVLPPVMVLLGLFDAFVPRETVERHMGPDAGPRGALLALLLGTAAAGPLFAAFPIAVALQRKGARRMHIVTFLGTWAAIKVPMVMLESTYLGLRFAMVRLALTVPAVLGMGLLVERLAPAPATVAEPAEAVA